MSTYISISSFVPSRVVLEKRYRNNLPTTSERLPLDFSILDLQNALPNPQTPLHPGGEGPDEATTNDRQTLGRTSFTHTSISISPTPSTTVTGPLTSALKTPRRRGQQYGETGFPWGGVMAASWESAGSGGKEKVGVFTADDSVDDLFVCVMHCTWVLRASVEEGGLERLVAGLVDSRITGFLHGACGFNGRCTHVVLLPHAVEDDDLMRRK